MRTLFGMMVFVLLITGCDSPERGALDPDTIAKKLFDAVRTDSEEKSQLLLPDKGTFRKIEAENGKEPADLNAAYESFSADAEKAFADIRTHSAAWDKATFTRSNYTESKLGKSPVARITTKFLLDGSPSKFECTAVKFNNRWYYYGDIVWVAKPD